MREFSSAPDIFANARDSSRRARTQRSMRKQKRPSRWRGWFWRKPDCRARRRIDCSQSCNFSSTSCPGLELHAQTRYDGAICGLVADALKTPEAQALVETPGVNSCDEFEYADAELRSDCEEPLDNLCSNTSTDVVGIDKNPTDKRVTGFVD